MKRKDKNIINAYKNAVEIVIQYRLVESPASLYSLDNRHNIYYNANRQEDDNMIDTSNAKWDFSKEEKYVIRWFNDNGYDGKILKQCISKNNF